VAGGGGGSQEQVPLNRYAQVLTGPTAFGTADLFAPGDINTGNIAGFLSAGAQSEVYLPRGYVSNTAISGATTWLGKDFSSFGLTAGQNYTWTWGVGASADSFNLQIVPEPSTFVLCALGALGLAHAIRRPRRPLT